MAWDVFISYAKEDKDSVVKPLAAALENLGVKVWTDTTILSIGDSLRRKIDDGLSRSRFGIVIISPAFIRKEWPHKELDGLVQRESNGEKVILPIWHDITSEAVTSFSPLLSSKVAGNTRNGVDALAAELGAVILDGESQSTEFSPTEQLEVTVSYTTQLQNSEEHRYSLDFFELIFYEWSIRDKIMDCC